MSTNTLIATGFVLAWSSGFIGAELGTQDASSHTLLLWRFLVVTAVAAAWWLIAGRRRLNARELGWNALIGALSQAVFLFAVVWSVELGVSPGTSALVASLQPLVAALAGGPLLGERTSALQWFGLAGGLAGVALVVAGEHGSGAPWPAYSLPVVAMLALVAATLLERASKRTTPLPDAMAVQCLISLVLFSVLAVATGTAAPPASSSFWAAVALTVVVSHLGGYGFYWLAVRRMSLARASSLLYLTPPTTMLLALVLFGDSVDGQGIAGTLLCLACVSAVHIGDRTRAVRPQPVSLS
jgi:drug/metabolite transporter (DMT)-like permease